METRKRAIMNPPLGECNLGIKEADLASNKCFVQMPILAAGIA